MRTWCWWRPVMVVVVVAAAVVGGSGQALAGLPAAAQLCEAQKNLAAGVKAACLAWEWGKVALGQAPDFGRCEENFTRAFARAEKWAGPGGCPTEGDTAAIEERVDACMAGVAAALGGEPPPPCTQFPATGQTTCYDSNNQPTDCANVTTSQDGKVRAGGALSYTDNGDGTITDNNTGLMWEKKSDDGSIHDTDNVYTWADAFTTFIAALNTEPCFAGHCDWRLPNVKELQSIVNYQNVDPAVSPAFNTGCAAACTVLTCSCTAAGDYWSSTSVVNDPNFAWYVFFGVGNVPFDLKDVGLHVRAVRGGS